MTVHQTVFIVCLTLLTNANFTASSCSPGCICIKNNMNCSETIPTTIPINTTLVAVTNVNYASYINKSPLMDSTWQSVRQLVIICGNSAKFRLERNHFINFNNLTFLKFSCASLVGIKIGTFDGLQELDTLDLSDNFELQIDTLVSGLVGNVLPKLKNLYLRQLARFSASNLHFDTYFFQALSNKPIQHLDLSNTMRSTMDPLRFANALPELRELNIKSGGHLAIYWLIAYRFFPSGSSFKHLKVLNLNYPVIPEGLLESGNSFDLITFDIGRLTPLNITDIRLRGVIPKGKHCEFHAITVTQSYKLCLDVHLIKSGIEVPIACVPYDENYGSYLELVDIAENGVEYIDPTFIQAANNVRYVDCSFNRLFMMNFSNISISPSTKTFKLEEFHCTHNELRIALLTRDVLQLTPKLRIINISYNLLESLTFDVTLLPLLEVLDLSYNKIHIIEPRAMDMFDRIVVNKKKLNTRPSTQKLKEIKYFKLTLTGNPLECTCEARKFVIWLTQTNVLTNRNVIHCELNGKTVLVNEKAISEVDNLCKRPMIIAVASSVSVVAAIIITIIVLLLGRRLKQRRNLKHFKANIEMFRQERNENRFAVFLSYSSLNEDLVLEQIYPEMNSRLKSILKTNENCVATGDFNFRLGFPVIEEIIKCIEASSVVIFCVSEAFCSSRWCKDEALAAYYEQKPMVLMFLEEVDVKLIPKVLNKPFQKTTRAKWIVGENGEYTMKPDWDNVCRSIVELIRPVE